MITAEQMRKGTVVDEERVEQLVRNTTCVIERAAAKGMHHAEAWIYDRFERRWLGDIPEAVINEAERRFTEAGYEFEWRSIPFLGGCVQRIVKW